MKKIFHLIICSLFVSCALVSCTPKKNSKYFWQGTSSQKIDYSNNPYVGLAGSSYKATAGDSSNFMVMMLWFYADGSGAWGYNKNNDVNVYTFHYVITGVVNVTFIEDESKERNSGYFVTYSDIGQCFVSAGNTFYRIS